MPKKRKEKFIPFPRKLFHEDTILSWKSKWFYTVLCELEHRYTGDHEDFFYRTQKALSEDTGMTPKMNKKCRDELVDYGWIQTWKMHWVDKKTGKKSEKYTVAFRLHV